MRTSTARCPSRHPRLALFAASAAAVLLLQACSALQIDVDVYKGPLVNNEQVQRDQLISMAMSAKTVLYTVRNKLLDEQCPPWLKGDDSRRGRVLLAHEWPIPNECKSAPQPTIQQQALNQFSEELGHAERFGGAQTDGAAQVRNAKRVNDILSFYDLKGQGQLGGRLDALREARERYLDLKDRYKNVRTDELPANADYRAAHAAAANGWRIVVDILLLTAQSDAKARGGLSPSVAYAGRAAAAEALALGTQPVLLACAPVQRAQRESGIDQWLAKAGFLSGQTHALEAQAQAPVGSRAAQKAIELALLADPIAGADTLLWADEVIRRSRNAKVRQDCGQDVPPAAAVTTQRLESLSSAQQARSLLPRNAPQINKADPPSSNDASVQQIATFRRTDALPEQTATTGITKEPPSPQLEKDEETLFKRLLDILSNLGATGFDRGRIEVGIDALADEYVARRDDMLKLDRPDPESAVAGDAASVQANPRRLAKARAEDAFSRLDHAVVDMAGRMQFLAANAWLLDGDTGDLRTYKALLESVANNLLVHADDLRNRAAHDERQLKAADQEQRNATRAFAVNAGATMRAIEARLDEGLKRAKSAEQAASAATQATGTQGEARTALDQAVATATDARAAKQTAVAKRMETAKLVATLRGALDKVKPEVETSEVAAFLVDSKALTTALKTTGPQRPASLSLEALRVEMAQSLATLAAPYQSAGLASSPNGLRLKALVAAAEALKPLGDASGPRAQQWTELRRFAGELDQVRLSDVDAAEAKLVKALAAEQQARDELIRRQKLLVAANTAGGASSQEYEAAKFAVDKLKTDVLKDVVSSGAVGDMNVVLAALRNAAQKVAGDDTPEKIKYRQAVEVFRDLPKGLQLQAEANGTRSIDVLDSVITQLRYKHLDLLSEKGPDDAETKRVETALVTARRQREDMVYLRPAATYLRAANPATELQTVSSPTRGNMLLASASETVRSFWNQAQRNKSELVRQGIDQTHWQNINTVRMSAAGSANFVLAKDDVGNWYAKAMGSDPTAMVNAAKNLALFNIGGSLDANLVRIDQLRSRLDATDSKLDDSQRADARKELDGLTGGGSGAAVTARSTTLGLFQQNFATVSAGHLKSLAEQLAGNAYRLAIRKRWDVTLKDSPSVKWVDEAFNSEQAQAQHQAAVAAAQPPAVTAAAAAASAAGAASAAETVSGSASGQAVLQVLRALQGLRVALKSAVQGDTRFTSEEAKVLDARNSEVKQIRAKQDGLAAQMTVAVAALKPGLQTTAIEADKARDDVVKLQAEQAAAQAALTAAMQQQIQAQALLQAAKARQDLAADDVDAVLKAAIKDMAALRLRSIEETETAVKIIGRNQP